MATKWRIGIDTGGTFTDFVFYRDGKLSILKLPSTPKNPADALVSGLRSITAESDSLFIVHGTTVATNSLLERKGGRIALITTLGFEDVLHIGRQIRQNLYRLSGENRIPLLPRRLCFGMHERVVAGGRVEAIVKPTEIENIIGRLKRQKVEAVAVSFIHAYANPRNETCVLEALEREGFLATASSRILPEHREYERTTVAAVNAFLMPVISRYLESLESKLGSTDLRIMQSNEGYVSPAIAVHEPIRTALSGPAGGVVAAFRVAKAAGYPQIITFDMGGTSTDVSLIPGRIQRSHQSQIGGFPIRLPMIDIHTVGAGGGSIAHVDRGGVLRVGPHSAGAEPGPACYGRSDLPAVTDANLVLGRLVPEFFLGGVMKLYPARSRAAIGRLARRIGKSLIETASGIVAIANASMEKAIRVISIERGIDPRSFALFSFGGAGGMHAVEIASRLKIATVIVPRNAGVLSAAGLLLADSVKDYSQSLLRLLSNLENGELERRFESLAQAGIKDMQEEGYPSGRISVHPTLDLRYLGQSYEITLPFRKTASLEDEFHRAHQRIYAYRQLLQPVEIVNIRVKAVGQSRKLRLPRSSLEAEDPKRAFFREQELIFQQRPVLARVFDRSRLRPGNVIVGPALIADRESTTLLPPRYRLGVDEYCNLIVHEVSQS